MLLLAAAQRKELRDRRQYVIDTGYATLGGKAITDHLKHLKD